MSGRRIGKLLTVRQVCEEYRRVYREARNGRLDMKDARGICWMLKELSFMIRETDLEQRLEALEEHAENDST